MDVPKNDQLIQKLPWPLYTLDFEASSLDRRSYPIEIGICRWSAPDAPLRVWSSLIHPHASWKAFGYWSESAQRIHGITTDDLVAERRSPSLIVRSIHLLVGGHACFCDGGRYDQVWARKLNNVADLQLRLRLGNWHLLMSELAPEGYKAAAEWLDNNRAPHRAGPDAERLMRALSIGLGLHLGKSIPMDPVDPDQAIT